MPMQSIAPLDDVSVKPPPDPTLALLDHIAILLPHKDLLNPPEWITKNFTVTPGGRHADGRTENKLIIFHDGSYIALASFLNDDTSGYEKYPGNRKPGIFDIVMTTDMDAQTHYKELQSRLSASGSNMKYVPPISGSRTRHDGVRLEWFSTYPERNQRGVLPFFCHDVTPRELRAPRPVESTKHPCLAYGIRSLIVTVQEDSAKDYLKAYSAVLGVENNALGDDLGEFTVDRVDDTEHAAKPAIQLRAPADAEFQALLAEQGVFMRGFVLDTLSNTSSKLVMQLDSGADMGKIMLEPC